jgi:hypothetical protein
MDRRVRTKFGAPEECRDIRALDHDCGIGVQCVAIENVAGRYGVTRGIHRVRVTFCKCRG